MNSIEKPNKKVLDIIAELDKQPEDCNKTYNFGACKIRHAIAVRDFKTAKELKKEPEPNPCYGCQLITGKLIEAAKKGKEHVDEQSNISAGGNDSAEADVQKKIDCESKPLVSDLVESPAEKTKEEVKAAALLNEEKVCPTCQKTFIATFPRSKFCSVKCRNHYNNSKKSLAKKLARRAASKVKENTEKTMKTETPKKEAPVNSLLTPVYFVSHEHAIRMAISYMQRFNDMVDHISDSLPDNVIRQITVYLSDDICHIRKMFEEYHKQITA